MTIIPLVVFVALSLSAYNRDGRAFPWPERAQQDRHIILKLSDAGTRRVESFEFVFEPATKAFRDRVADVSSAAGRLLLFADLDGDEGLVFGYAVLRSARRSALYRLSGRVITCRPYSLMFRLSANRTDLNVPFPETRRLRAIVDTIAGGAAIVEERASAGCSLASDGR